VDGGYSLTKQRWFLWPGAFAVHWDAGTEELAGDPDGSQCPVAGEMMKTILGTGWHI